MGVKAFCNNLITAYTHCNEVKAIYTYGQFVWPTGPVPPGVYYVSWLPSDLSGTFSLFGSTYSLQDYSGFYSWYGRTSGYITQSAFEGLSSMTYMETNVKSLNNSAFKSCYGLQTVSMLNLEYVGSYAFTFCSSLMSIDFPSCLSIGNYGFNNCFSLSYASLPNCSYIGSYAFNKCSLLQSIDLPSCSSIGSYGFNSCISLSTVNLPECSMIGGSTFRNCTLLSYISVPKLGGVPIEAFMNCTHLMSIELTTGRNWVRENAFNNCELLSYVDLGSCTAIRYSAFNNCTSLSTMYLRSKLVVELNSTSSGHVFSNTPFARCEGSIYVPVYLYSLYWTDSKWSSLRCVLQSYTPEPGGPYYISWLPSGSNYSSFSTFSISGVNFDLNDWDGYFDWFDGVITGRAFINCKSISYLETNAYIISSSAFYNCSSLMTVSLSECENIGWSAFQSCSRLNYQSTLYLPKCKRIDSNAFNGCPISSLDAPMCTYVGDDAFAGCSYLNSISLPVCTTIQDWAFAGTSLVSVYLPMCQSIYSYAFRNCYRLTNIDLPACTLISNNTFISCTSLVTVSIPECINIGMSAFYSCLNLKSIELSKCEQIHNYAFMGCREFSIIKIYTSSVCRLVSTAASDATYIFDGTKITASTGYIYVPSSLVSAYKNADTWIHFKNRIFPIPV